MAINDRRNPSAIIPMLIDLWAYSQRIRLVEAPQIARKRAVDEFIRHEFGTKKQAFYIICHLLRHGGVHFDGASKAAPNNQPY